jgi:hypothetical protein
LAGYFSFFWDVADAGTTRCSVSSLIVQHYGLLFGLGFRAWFTGLVFKLAFRTRGTDSVHRLAERERPAGLACEAASQLQITGQFVQSFIENLISPVQAHSAALWTLLRPYRPP